MKIIIDGYENLVIPEENETLGEFLSQLNEWIKKNRRVVIQVKLEGKSLSHMDRSVIFNKEVSEFKVLEVSTANLWEWAINSLREIKLYLPEIARGMERASSLIQQGELKSALSILDRFMSLWDDVNETLRMVERNFALDYSQIPSSEKKSTLNMDELVSFLKEAKRAMKDSDFSTLADILEYELAPRIKGKEKLVDEITMLLKHKMN